MANNRQIVLLPHKVSEFELVADYFEGQIDLKAFRSQFTHYPVLCANPLVIEPEAGSYIYLEKFGGLVFWNCSPTTINTLLGEIGELENMGTRVEAVRDILKVHVGGEDERVDFSDVWIGDLTLGKLKIISLALAQSVALDHFEGTVKRAMAGFSPVMRDLSHYGKLFLSRHETLKTIGFAMEVRAVVLDNLTLFDAPPETWESETLAHLDSALFDHFDIEERHSAIQQKLSYLSDAGARVMDVLTTRKSHQLEWIVIALIAVEVVFFLWKEVAGLFS
jgi:uncharacterized Rmd1/YagE family protein